MAGVEHDQGEHSAARDSVRGCTKFSWPEGAGPEATAGRSNPVRHKGVAGRRACLQLEPAAAGASAPGGT